MNNKPTKLSRAAPLTPAQDYDRLFVEGLHNLQALAGMEWTDYNAHDPGVTLLEQVCYAITDLAYRIDFDVPDLLASGQGDAYASTPTPAQILHSSPVTLTDLRKLLIDVPGIKDAWIEPTTQSLPLYYQDGQISFEQQDTTDEELRLRGLYQVTIKLDDIAYVDITQVNLAQVRRMAFERLYANRGLCEDFEHIDILDTPEKIVVKASVEIAQVEDAERILLEIYQRFADYISPPVPVHTLDEWLASGRPVEDIFAGPYLENGFIDTDDLYPRRLALRTSDMIRETMQVPGVLAVRHIKLASGQNQQLWSLDLDPNRAPVFDPASAAITLLHRQHDIKVDTEQVRSRFQDRLSRQSNALTTNPIDLPPPRGRDRGIVRYFSIHDQLPTAYGVGAAGLPNSSLPQRQAQARQLQAYLLFFDQILANCFAQLAHIPNLFSVTATESKTYFAQMVAEQVEGRFKDILSLDLKELEDITEHTTDTTPYERRNRFLNHLLARYAENGSEFSLLLNSNEAAQWVKVKSDYLQAFSSLSAQRGSGANLLIAPPKDDASIDEDATSANVSGLEARLRAKLGLDKQDDIYIVEHILLRPLPGDEKQLLPVLIDSAYHDPYSLRLSVILLDNSERKAFIEQMIREETPAHLALEIHWLTKAKMDAFRKSYTEWWTAYAKYQQGRSA